MEAIGSQPLGRQVGDFRLLEEIGQGGMGTAYRGEQLTLRREVVIKVIAATDDSPDHQIRFLREARLASRLDHPYAAHVYAFGAEPDGLLWIAMELVRGTPLDRLIAEQGPMPLGRFVPFFERLCEVVFSAHEQGIIHRDIKPANVMVVRRAGRLLPKLLDFGIARAVVSVELGDQATPSISGLVTPGRDTLEAYAGDAALDAKGSLTVRGRVVGSPAYMAPEQWSNAARADARTDLYALAITAFELLTGRLPFTGATVMATARAHARAEVPPLGAGLPVALDRVLARALAKRSAERYPDVLELSTAIREVARDARTEEGGGDLDEVVRDAFIQGGPQPVAESLLALSAAREPAQAWEAVWRVVAIVVRALGAIAIAARARVGERAADDDAAARVRTLVERGLDLEEWVALVGALVEPYRSRAQAHPVPELVGLFWQGDRPRGAFDELLVLRRSAAEAAVEPALVHTALAELGKLLRICTFLTEYGWVVAATGDGGEGWMGPRRHPRERRPVPATAAPGTVWLIDLDGAPVLELSPIVRIAPPSPGADDEAFLLDGPARRGARAIAWPREFERHDEELWSFVDTQVAALGDRAAGTDHDERAPYRGLATFGPGDAAMFFGREREVEAVVNRLRVQPMLAVVGPSGVGKSSFVQAGVIPTLPETWQAMTLRPGGSPLVALEARLAAAGVPVAGLAERLREDPAALRPVVEEAARRIGARIVLVIDQLEEMFTQCRDAATREAFGHALASVAVDADVPVRVVLTLRDDFLVRAAELPGLGPRLSGGLELLTLPDAEVLRRILVEPLARVGYAFEDGTLPDEMVAAVRDHPGALALLSFAAAKLWELRDRRFRHVPRKAYDAIGGVAGALARHAEDTLEALPAEDRGQVRELFRHLVTSEGTRAALRRVEAIQLLGKTTGAERVIEALLERRLLVSYEGDGQTDWIEVIHEALLTAWPRLVTWQREDAEGARLRDQVRAAARQWAERGRPRGMLWRGEALVEYRLWRSRHRSALTDVEQAFADASVADDTRGRRRRRLALIAVVAGLTIGIVVLQRANGIARRNAAESRRTALALLAEQGRAALVSGKPQDAIVYLSAAYTRGADDPNLRFLLGVAGRQLGGELAILRGHTAGVKAVVVGRDGRQIVTAGNDDTVRVWNAHTGALEQTIATSCTTIQLTVDGGVVTSGKEPPAVWDLATGARRFTVPVEATAVAVTTPDRATILTVEPVAGQVRTWAATDGRPIRTLAVTLKDPPIVTVNGDRFAVATPDGVAVGSLELTAAPVVFATARPPRALALGGDGTRVAAVADQSREPQVWDVDHPEAPRALTGHTGDVLYVRFSPDGRRVATSSLDHSAKIWDTASGRLINSLDGHDGYILPVEWSPDGELVATGSIDRTARLWTASTGAVRAIFYGHTDVVYRIAFDPTGHSLVTGSFDGTARIFDTSPPGDAFELHHGGGPVTVRFSADSRRLLAVGREGAAWVYDVATRAVIATIPAHGRPEGTSRLEALRSRLCGDIDPTGAAILIPVDTEAHLIHLADPDHPVVFGPHPAAVSCARLVPGGGAITTTAEGELRVWTATGELARTIAIGKGDRLADIEIDAIHRRVVAASFDGNGGRVIDVDGTRAPVMLPGGNGIASGIAITRDGSRVALAGQDTVARVFDAATGAQQTASHSLSDLQDVDFSPDDRRIAVANTEGTVTIYDGSDGRLLTRYGDTSGWATGVDFSPDGQLLAAADDTGRIRVWNVAVESRTPAVVARQVECHVPEVLVGTRLIAQAVSAQCAKTP